MPESSCARYSGYDGELNRDLFASSADCIKVLDLEGRLLQLNAGGVIALELDTPEQLAGAVWWSIWPEDTQALAQHAFDSARMGQIKKFHAFCPTAQGTPRWWDVVTSPVFDAFGAVREVMVVSRDVSELFLARQALRVADLRKDAFLATVAHELRNPIAAATNAAEILKRKAFDHGRTAEFAQLIQRQMVHMSHIAEELLDVSRIGRGEISLNQQRVEISAVVAEAAEQLQSGLAAKAQRLTVHIADGVPAVNGDHTRLVQVVGNLLGNAVRYSDIGGAIAIEVSQQGGMVELAVTDNGIGIPAENLRNIFDLYAQVHKSPLRQGAGLGLGLSLVKALVLLHGGSVEACSEGQGKGSRFTVRLQAA
ncbi:ATP-binding protein [Janthinobacterium sp. RB2R34]|uniref:PAS domain-containing sensor histidine kinase n=1 Tax=Janthinobacterium sp. RB2R34 TaxID=3424193 RepID=UPI003F2892AA